MRILAMIPARMGSKRIVRKNVRYMAGQPLISYAMSLAAQSKAFDQIWVNSEEPVFGEIGKQFGIRYHARPAELANDIATNREFTYEFLKQHDCDFLVMVNSTSPVLRVQTIMHFVNFVKRDEYDTVLSVVSERAETFFKEQPLNFSLGEKRPSQALEPTQKVVWALTAWRRSTFLKLQESGECPVFGGRLSTFEIPKDEACDLDTEEDWRIAEGILLSRQRPFPQKYFESIQL
ncbi:MAG: hypothetical protein A2Y14_01390 [Verrucomicrobia bacterium GWF2_51_19]|nr:MAG: hypothetical protein A2Y14_01390 [Verrucomicrobia bacterium GWF2_51_19]